MEIVNVKFYLSSGEVKVTLLQRMWLLGINLNINMHKR